jgi:hypothetical protein
MNIFEEAKKLANQRYDRAKLHATTAALITRFRLLQGDMSKIQGACRHLADALDRLSGSTLQERWNAFEKKIWTKWKVGINRPSTLWTWGARVVVPTRMVIPSMRHFAHSASFREHLDEAPRAIIGGGG